MAGQFFFSNAWSSVDVLIMRTAFCFLVLEIHSRPAGRWQCIGFSICPRSDNCWLLSAVLGELQGWCWAPRMSCPWHSTFLALSAVRSGASATATCAMPGLSPTPAVVWHNLSTVLSCLALTLIAFPKLNLWTPRGYAPAKDHWASKDQEEAGEEGWLVFRPIISFRHSLVLTESLEITCRISAQSTAVRDTIAFGLPWNTSFSLEPGNGVIQREQPSVWCSHEDSCVLTSANTKHSWQVEV